MLNALHLLKSYRERTGIPLQDMASIIGIDTGNLSKIEHGKLEPNILVLFSYHLVLKISVEKLFKNHYPEITKACLGNAEALREKLMEGMTTPHIDKRLMLVDTIVDRLTELHDSYGK